MAEANKTHFEHGSTWIWKVARWPLNGEKKFTKAGSQTMPQNEYGLVGRLPSLEAPDFIG